MTITTQLNNIYAMNKRLVFLLTAAIMMATAGRADDLRLNDKEYFERQGINILVFSNSFNGGRTAAV